MKVSVKVVRPSVITVAARRRIQHVLKLHAGIVVPLKNIDLRRGRTRLQYVEVDVDREGYKGLEDSRLRLLVSLAVARQFVSDRRKRA